MTSFSLHALRTGAKWTGLAFASDTTLVGLWALGKADTEYRTTLEKYDASILRHWGEHHARSPHLFPDGIDFFDIYAKENITCRNNAEWIRTYCRSVQDQHPGLKLYLWQDERQESDESQAFFLYGPALSRRLRHECLGRRGLCHLTVMHRRQEEWSAVAAYEPLLEKSTRSWCCIS